MFKEKIFEMFRILGLGVLSLIVIPAGLFWALTGLASLCGQVFIK